MRKRLLVVTPSNIYPRNHGGKIDIYNSLMQIKDSKIDLNIDLLYCDYAPHDVEVDKSLIDELGLCFIYYLPIRKSIFKSIFYLFSYLPNYCMLYRELRFYKFNHKYDYVLVHGFHVDTIIKNSFLQGAKFIYRMHNYEFLYSWKKIKFETGLINKFVRVLDAYKIKIRETWLLKVASKILFISHKEYVLFNKKFGNKSYFLPTYMNNSSFLSYEISNKLDVYNVLFVGNLFTGYNLHGLYWYISFIHPLVKSIIPSYRFIIVGNSAGFSIDKLKILTQNDSFIELHENVEDLVPYYRASRVFVNPMIDGAGVKIKTLDAITNGLPLVSTSVGVEGTGLEHNIHCYVSDDHERFANLIIKLLRNNMLSKKFVTSSQCYIKEHYCNTRIIHKVFGDNM